MNESFSQTSITQRKTREIKNRHTSIDFQFIDNLIYHIHENNDQNINESKLCISKNCQQKIFKVIYNDNFHVEQHKIY